MKYLPKKIIRWDGSEFLLNEISQRYSLWIPDREDHIVREYDYETLMETHKDEFKVADGTEDLLAMKKAWLNRIKWSSGCGDGDDDDEC